MKYDPDRNHRRSLRLADYDYSSPGAYFITICTQGREELLGSVANGELALSGHGQNVERCLRGLPARFSGVTLDVFAIMPNHVHFILWIGGVGAIQELPLLAESSPALERLSRRSMLLPKIIGYFKMNTARAINRARETTGARFWQRNYYERVVRNDDELNALRQYIIDNPANWEADKENPGLQRKVPVS